ncbi:hypothetical protein CEXT_152721 [Caerostris extrusa]|uniref:Uncharacterized protein n=1 Tax=Caerostris extrusa TaxID=172846 RepID=A0AAV4XF34_CAEEX|nr:hypothetical protein CEXT_152721 [Caerostris extrusa]
MLRLESLRIYDFHRSEILITFRDVARVIFEMAAIACRYCSRLVEMHVLLKRRCVLFAWQQCGISQNRGKLNFNLMTAAARDPWNIA